MSVLPFIILAPLLIVVILVAKILFWIVEKVFVLIVKLIPLFLSGIGKLLGLTGKGIKMLWSRF